MGNRKTKNHMTIRELVESDILPGANTETSVRALVAKRKIPFRKLGGRVFFLKDEVVEWLRSQPGNPLQGKRRRPNAEIKHLSEVIQEFDSTAIRDLRKAVEELALAIELQNI